ncbi:MAG TPA: SDR family NAD(P)-dependent oxidoreductase [Acidimicrobiales bacterium]|nr:SDR family NAD(P)-dependent oxidoreductase [Acidimicrobiales bacterium]
MELTEGKVAVVTGAASGIGLALAERFASSGLHVVLADVDATALATAAAGVRARGVEALEVACDVSDEAAVEALAVATTEHFGTVHVVCNNAGVSSQADPWGGPVSSWKWVLGVNLWGVVHGVRAFLPHLLASGGGHIVNTASIAGLYPGFGASYDASKHAVVALTEDLYRDLQSSGQPVGVSVLCPGWVRTGILDADRNWPAALGEAPPTDERSEVVVKYVRRAIDEGTTPAAVADLVADAIVEGRFWVFPHDDFVELAVQRWHEIAERQNPALFRDTPGLPPVDQIVAEVLEGLAE